MLTPQRLLTSTAGNAETFHHHQLHQLLGFKPSVVVDYLRVGHSPSMDFVGSSRQTFGPNARDYTILAEQIVRVMAFVSHEDRVEGAILGMMSCMLPLYRHPTGKDGVMTKSFALSEPLYVYDGLETGR